MKFKKVYFLNQDLGVQHTGIESSALLRYRLFANQLNIQPVFITAKYRSQLSTEIKILKQQAKLPSEATVINIYDFYQQLLPLKDAEISLYNGEVIVSLIGNHYQNYLDIDGNVRGRAFYNQSNQRLHYIVHFFKGTTWRRDYYHESGRLSCTHLLDTKGQKVLQEIFYRSDHTVCIIKNYFYDESGDRSGLKIQVFDAKGIAFVTDQEASFIEYFLTQYLSEKDDLSILIVDKNRVFYEPAISARNQLGRSRVKVITAIHNLHAVNYHKKETSRININYVSVFKDLTQPDAVIVQTNIQRNDIIARFGNTQNVYAIPHSYECQWEIDQKKCDQKPYKAVYFARYNHDKKHELAIDAFAKVVEKLPQAQFHCYGSGSRFKELQQLVQHLKLENNIFLHGWCDSVSEQYESAALSIISSESESFSLTIAESLAHGCPVIGFDVPYGPKELVHSGENGYLVPYKDTVAMAECILKVMLDSSLQRTLSENAKASAKRYSEIEVKKLWRQVFDEMI
ncbi:glycosyltransferase [Ignatzschineria rhizosphaerae]|uniref:Glycosyltransferase n=1 Tax=Ignatzschineria rhizosphaerae TaxID=2923279 RepID=A0ABY3X423_9GAMM|nr:glycosyltransferase [Ignatzschineria rhizosphaerae]UNM96439.1 glycosyltransferase [Ignatzschineria rhizosphaerae]